MSIDNIRRYFDVIKRFEEATAELEDVKAERDRLVVDNAILLAKSNKAEDKVSKLVHNHIDANEYASDTNDILANLTREEQDDVLKDALLLSNNKAINRAMDWIIIQTTRYAIQFDTPDNLPYSRATINGVLMLKKAVTELSGRASDKFSTNKSE